MPISVGSRWCRLDSLVIWIELIKPSKDNVDVAEMLMRQFAEATGVTSDHPSRRYLWTDAYAVCNFLELARRLRRPDHLDTAVALVDQVHYDLGRYSAADARQGWISGLDDDTGRAHPTAGGLRIGKPNPERQPDDPYDPQREWDLDGQYFHYLTKWIHALRQVAKATGQIHYRQWAEELAIRSYQGFRASNRSLVWKMSIDLSRPLVQGMGLHDPLDGLVTALVLLSETKSDELQGIVNELESMCRGANWVSDDPLGIGGLLFDACRLAQLDGQASSPYAALLVQMLGAVEVGLQRFFARQPLQEHASQRLAFRELGLAIGLHALDMLYEEARDVHLIRLDAIARYAQSASSIEQFWLDDPHRQVSSWSDHTDINTVMLATSLIPEGVLVL